MRKMLASLVGAAFGLAVGAAQASVVDITWEGSDVRVDNLTPTYSGYANAFYFDNKGGGADLFLFEPDGVAASKDINPYLYGYAPGDNLVFYIISPDPNAPFYSTDPTMAQVWKDGDDYVVWWEDIYRQGATNPEWSTACLAGNNICPEPDYNDAGIRVSMLGTPAEVPLPGAIWLFGSALLGFVTWSRRRAA